MNEISHKEFKNNRSVSFIKGFFNKTPKNIFGFFFVFSLILIFFFGLGFGVKADAATYNIGPGQTYTTFTALIAAVTLQSDDIVDGGGNTFKETITPATSGVSLHPIIFRNATIDGENSRNYGVNINGKSYWRFENITVIAPKYISYYVHGLASNIVIDTFTQPAGLYIISITDASDVTVSNGTITSPTDAYGGTIYILSPASNISVSNVTISNSHFAGIYSNGAAGVTLNNIEVTGALNHGIAILNMVSGSISMTNVYSGVTRSGVAGANGGYGVYVKSSNVLFTGSGIFSNNNTYGGITFETSSLTAGSTLSNFQANNTPGTSNGVVLINTSNLTLSHGTANYNGNNGLVVMGASSTGVITEYVTTNYNKDDGMNALTGVTGWTVRYSEASYNGTAGDEASGDGFSIHDTCTAQFYYDLAIANKNTAMAHVQTSSGVIYNSTFVNNGDQTDSAKIRCGIYLSTTANPGFIVKNNISVGSKNCEVYESSTSHNTFDNNIYLPLDNAKFYTVNGSTYTSWADYHATKESHSSNADPIFTSSSDFHLQPTSPAINAGTNSIWTGINNIIDYVGNLITDGFGAIVASGGTVDIGAYEFQAPNSPATLSQYKADGTTAITSGTFTNEDSVVLKFNMSSSEYNSSDLLTPQVEIQELATPFTNTVTNSGIAVAYSGSDVTGTVTVTGLTSGKTYHWQARVSNPATTSAWVSKGGSPDFQVDTTAPLTPLATPSTGTYNTTQSITLTADGSDSIRYSTTETPATCSAGTLYSDSTPISIAISQTIYVRACDTLNNFSTASFAYVISRPTSSGSTLAYRNNFLAQQQALTSPIQQPLTIPAVTSTTPIIINRILKLTTPRMWGDDIKALQTFLNTKGYNTGIPDGNFGPKTQTAVIAFQKANGLVPDGSVGINTLNYLNGNQTTTTTSLIIQPTVTRTLKLLVPRMIGDDVKTLQTYLSEKGYDIGTLDGVLGSKTCSAVVAFQTANGLTPDGLVGAKTREMMK